MKKIHIKMDILIIAVIFACTGAAMSTDRIEFYYIIAAFGLLLGISAFLWCIPAIKRIKYRKDAKRCQDDKSYQKKILEKCTEEEREILCLLYERYPVTANYRVDNDAIMSLYDKGFLIASPLIVLRSNQFQRMYTIQEWAKQSIDNWPGIMGIKNNSKKAD